MGKIIVRAISTLAVWISFTVAGSGQNYHAINGSYYAGALGVHNNPAALLSTPFKWDIALFGIQETNSTNSYSISNYSLLSNPAGSKYYFNKGNFSRFGDLNLNLNLINTRFALNRKNSFAFGANLKSYTNASSNQFNFIDTLKGTGNFFEINNGNNNLQGRATSSSWLELYLSYAHTLFNNSLGRLNYGATLKLNKGFSGAYAAVNTGQWTSNFQNNKPIYTVTNVNALYAYSANYDKWNKNNSSASNLNNFLLANTEGGASFDLGVEYLIKPQGTTSFYDDENYFDYDWKIGLSLLDIGATQYKGGAQSRTIYGINGNINNGILDKKFDSSTRSFAIFNDSLETITQLGSLSGTKYRIINPMRLVINIDHYLIGNFFLNGELVLSMPPKLLKKYQRVKDIGMITLTPRWETKNLAFYLPIQFNSNNQFWIGGAFKAGPLLLGVHNWANVLSKNKTQNGGGYIALIFHSPSEWQSKQNKNLDCPKPVW